MTELVQAAAKAIYEGRNGAGCKPWSIQTKAHKEPYLADARAAVLTVKAYLVDSRRDTGSAISVLTSALASQLLGTENG